MSAAAPPDPDLARLWERWTRQRAPGARDQLIVHYSSLVKFVAGRLGIGNHPTVEASDLVSAGIFGLIDAIERFEPQQGFKFESFAAPRIRGAIYDGLRDLDWVPRSVRARARQIEGAISDFEHREGRAPSEPELAKALDIGVDELAEWVSSVASTTIGPLDRALDAGAEPSALDGRSPPQPSAVVEANELRTAMRRELRRLPEREKLVLGLYFDEGLTLAEIGEVLGVSESRVSQIRITAVMHLRARLSAGGLT
ncbi:MAG: FliA/WhiG family RNA polymerase sigma factor [Actinomycetota bacterium]|nr:FliA/WhiG family RNA polymerase sigma factor [Actinomycetota bacterium]